MRKFTTVKSLTSAIILVAVVGYGISLWGVYSTLSQEGLFDYNLCLSNACVELFQNKTAASLAIAKATSDFLVALATVGGIVVAMLSYFSSVDNSALANHIAHYSTFQQYVHSEISKRRRVDISSIDTFFWYNLIFPHSKRGDMSVSETYKTIIGKVEATLHQSNQLVDTANPAGFRFKNHQEEMKRSLLGLRIAIPNQPRLEFYEIEDQIVSLITCVNQAFSPEGEIPAFSLRKYL
jgi:hypothetical protein